YNKELEDGKYCAITPCFRVEAVESEITRPYFMKVELIHITKESLNENLTKMINDARSFFNCYVNVRLEKTSESKTSYDINHEKTGIELGSYGIREYNDIGTWIFGTGCAEPRL